MTDTDALQRYAVHRDPAALAHLVQQHQQMVYGVCLRRLRHEADARDAAQETFLKLANAAGAIHGNPTGWLHRCATTTSLDLIRSASRRRAREERNTSADTSTCPATDAGWNEARASLDDTLEELPDAQRDLIVQRFLAQRKVADLAAEQRVSESMISRRVNAALDELRKRLTAKGFGVGLATLTTGLTAEAAVAVPPTLTATLLSPLSAPAAGASAPVLATAPGMAPASASIATTYTTPVGWLWMGTKIKLSTAILGSLSIHGLIVAAYLTLGLGPTPGISPTNSGNIPAVSPAPHPQPAAPRPADPQTVIRVADAQASPPAPEDNAAAEDQTETDGNAEKAAGFVYIMGDSPRPGAYSIPAEVEFTLKQLIASSGGASPINGRGLVVIRRVTNPDTGEAESTVVLDTTLEAFFENREQDFVLRPDDLIEIGEPNGKQVTSEPIPDSAEDATPPAAAADIPAGLFGKWRGTWRAGTEQMEGIEIVIRDRPVPLLTAYGPDGAVGMLAEVLGVDLQADPARLNLRPLDLRTGETQEGSAVPFPTIIELDGDTLRWSYFDAGETYPPAFGVPDAELFEMQRVLPEVDAGVEVSQPTAEAGPAPAGVIEESVQEVGGFYRTREGTRDEVGEITFELWQLRDLIQHAYTPIRWSRVRIEGVTLPLDQPYSGRVEAAGPIFEETPEKELQALLEWRFGFQVRRVTEPTEAMVLRLAADGQHRLQPYVEGSGDRGRTGSEDGIDYRGTNMPSLAATLEYSVLGAVIDETGLAGDWDFTLPRLRGKSREEVAAVVRESLGLEVLFETRPIEFLVVEPGGE